MTKFEETQNHLNVTFLLPLPVLDVNAGLATCLKFEVQLPLLKSFKDNPNAKKNIILSLKIVLQKVGFEISGERQGLLLQSRKMAKR